MKLYQNKVKLTINGKEFTNNIPFPIKWNELLDSQLDEASIELLQVEESSFMPLSEAKLEVWNEQDPSRVLTMHYLIASDKSDEIPSGSGKFNHSISLVERTKWLERFICRSQGYVNSILKDYKQIKASPLFKIIRLSNEEDKEYINIANASILTPQKTGEIIFPSWRDMINRFNGDYGKYKESYIYTGYVSVVDFNETEVFRQTNLDESVVFREEASGTYKVVYYCNEEHIDLGIGEVPDIYYTTWEVIFYFAIV